MKVERGEEVVISTVGAGLGSGGGGGQGLLESEVPIQPETGAGGSGSGAGSLPEHAGGDGLQNSIIPAADYILQAQSCVPAITTDVSHEKDGGEEKESRDREGEGCSVSQLEVVAVLRIAGIPWRS